MQQNNLISNLGYLIEQHGVTAVEVADTLSLSPLSVIKIKNGELPNPNINTVIALSKYFKVPLEKLVFDKLS